MTQTEIKEFPRHLVNRTPATIRHAFDKAGEPDLTETGDMASINISSILTRLIQDAGRFAENWASDVLYVTDHIRELCDTQYFLDEDIDEIFALGIRDNGVDPNPSIMSQFFRSRQYMTGYVTATPYYRRILAVRVHVAREPIFPGAGLIRPRVTCELKNLTHKFLHINEADLDSSGNLLTMPYKDGNPIPIDPYHRESAAV